MACLKEANSNEYIELLLDYELTPEEISSSTLDFCSVRVGDGISIIYVNVAQVERLNQFLIRYPYIPKCYGLMQDEAVPVTPPDRAAQPITQNGGIIQPAIPSNVNLQPLDAAGILRVQNRPLSLTGKGVVIGFVDTGIRYDLPHFRYPDGSSRILAIWDQTIDAGAAPEGFDYGTEYRREAIDAALQTDDPYETVPTYDENGHGTKMASVAAGSMLGEGVFRGAAYDCEIVMVKLRQSNPYFREYYLIPEDAVSYSDPDILLGLKYLQTFSETFQRPLVICFGIGTSFGNHAGDSLMSKYLDSIAVKRNQVVVVAGGNEGNSAGHFHGTIPLQALNNWVDCELLVGENGQGFLMELWGKVPDIFTISITSPAGEIIPRISYQLQRPSTYRFVYSDTIVTVEYILVEQGSGEELILIRFENPLAGIWQIRVFAEGQSGNAEFDMWLPLSQFLGKGTSFLKPNPDITLTEPAYAENALSVTTYQSANNSFYLNSGRGFAADGYIQPDLAAPGVGIATALGSDSGSSLAAAIAAGAVADFMQWAVIEGNEVLANTESVRNYLIRGAGRENSLVYPNNSWGYGRLNLGGTFDRIAGVSYT